MRGNILFMVLFPHISLHSSFCQRCRSFSSLPFVCFVRTHGLEFAWRTAHFPVKLVFYKSQTLRRNWRTPFFERISLYKWGPRPLVSPVPAKTCFLRELIWRTARIWLPIHTPYIHMLLRRSTTRYNTKRCRNASHIYCIFYEVFFSNGSAPKMELIILHSWKILYSLTYFNNIIVWFLIANVCLYLLAFRSLLSFGKFFIKKICCSVVSYTLCAPTVWPSTSVELRTSWYCFIARNTIWQRQLLWVCIHIWWIKRQPQYSSSHTHPSPRVVSPAVDHSTPLQQQEGGSQQVRNHKKQQAEFFPTITRTYTNAHTHTHGR